MTGKIADADADRALGFFARACELRFQAGCLNVLDPSNATVANPRPFDLRLLLREGGQNLLEMPEPELYQRACEHGWNYACNTVVSMR